LVERLSYAPEDEGLVRALVGDALLVESVDAALRLHRGGCPATLVAMDGSVLRPDGRLGGRAGDAVNAGMVAQKREVRELHRVVSEKGDVVTRMLEAQQALRLRITEVGAALDRARSEAHQGELALVTAEKDLKRAEEQLAGVDKRRAQVNRELEELEE